MRRSDRNITRGLARGLAAGLLIATTAAAASAQVVISQVYGGGGNSGAPLNQDFVELYNYGDTAIDISGWSIQYGSATGTVFPCTASGCVGVLPAGSTIQPCSYFLVAMGTAGANGSALPTPDATGPLLMGASSGRVALVNTSGAVSGCYVASILDFVGFGTTAICYETAPTANLSNTTAAIRKGDGNQDTNNNSADFDVLTPAPRNSASPVNELCRLAVPASATSWGALKQSYR